MPLYRLSTVPRVILSLVILFLAAMPGLCAPRLAVAQATSNPVAAENALPGIRTWTLDKPANNHEIEGYASSTSVAPGERIGFAVSTTAPSFTADILRMGWYHGDGARRVQAVARLTGHAYPIPHPDPTTGLVDCHWPDAFTLSIPTTWLTGVYLVKLTASTGYQAYIPFVVRSLLNNSDFVFVRAVTTDAAYNQWGGASLYHDYTGKLPSNRALQVSFNRPFALNPQNDVGAGLFLFWEYHMVRWLEQHDYNVSYVTDVDVHQHPELLLHHKAVLVVGHDEYWSKEMRDGVEAAVNSGINLGVFGANTAYWQIRFAPSDGVADRIIVCYKLATLDPLNGVDNSRVTVRWRDPPVNRPESALLGAMYPNTDGEVKGAGAWNMTEGARWPFSGVPAGPQPAIPGLVGYEYDAVAAPSEEPQNLVVLGTSTVHNLVHNVSDVANTTFYTAPSGARVFDAGTIQWSWGLDDLVIKGVLWSPQGNTVSTFCQDITQGLLQDFLTKPSVPLPAAQPVLSGVVGNAGWYRSAVNVSLVPQPGAQRLEYSLDGGKTWLAYSNPVTVTQQGLVSVSSHAITVDGLVGQTYTTAFQIDTLPPATSLTTSGPCALADDGLHTPDVQIISMAAQDSGSGVAGILYSNDGQNWLPYLQPVALRARHPRPFFYRSMDVAGNLEPVQQTALDGSPSCPF